MKNTIKRLIASLLCLCMLTSVLPLQIWSEERPAAARIISQGEQPAFLDTADGEIAVEEDWNETYPYGTFAFGTHQADVGEPGAKTKDGEAIPQTILIPVYRLGGTVGRVTAKITFAPAVTTEADGTGSVYDYAASGKQDLKIEYENPNPLAYYQDLGVSLAERRMTASAASVIVPEAPENAKNEDEMKLTVSETADSYRWQVKRFGIWNEIRDANGSELILTWGDIWDFENGVWSGLDFRCILEHNGVLTCTPSMMGEAFEPMSETPAVPENLNTEADPGYSELVFDDDYDVYRFDLTFAEGETVKYIRVTALDDGLSELPEMGLFTITACQGGELSDMCNTLTLMVSDNDEAEASEVGFAAASVTASRADQTARVKVSRTGGKTYNVTVRYETVDGTARAGVDYARKEGELAFAGSIDEIEIPIELIATDDTSEKTFDLVLTELRGGGDKELCRLSSERVTVTITGKAPEKQDDGSGQNLASLLAGGDGEDVSAQVQTGKDALIGSAGETAVSGHSDLPEPEELKATIYTPESTRMHVLTPHFTFSRGSTDDEIAAYKENYWQDYEFVLGADYETDTSRLMKYRDKLTFTLKNGAPSAATATHGEVDFQYTTEFGFDIIQKVEALLANYDATAQISIPNAGKYFGSLVFAARLNIVGIKKRSNGSLYLRPDVVVFNQYTSQNARYEMQTNWDFADKDARNKHRYYWFTDGGTYEDNPEGGTTSYGADRGVDSWKGKGDVGEAPIPWDIGDTGFNIDFRMLKQWGDTPVSQNEVCQNGENTELFILYYSLGRRKLYETRYNIYPNQIEGNGIPIVVYTANDTNTAGAYTPITDYSFISPEISIVQKAGGVSSDGALYVGSKLRIKFDSSQMAGFSVAQNGLFLTNSSGTRVVTAKKSENDGEYILELLWDGMNDASLWDTYQLNIILERTQSFEIDIVPSTPKEENGTYDYSKVWNAFMARGPKVYASSLTYDDKDFPVPYIPTEGGQQDYYVPNPNPVTLDKSKFTASSGHYTLTGTNALKNVQAVNFNQDADDVILYNGRAYAGNETIPITVADMTHGTLLFIFYDSDFLEAVSPMEVFIDRVEVYYDKNGDGIINGSSQLSNLDTFVLETETVPDPDHPGETITRTKDDFIGIVDGEYQDSFFKPYVIRDKDGNITKVCQYFFKVFLTMRPRSMVVPAGADPDGKAQFLPAFLSAITDPEEAAELTEEQKSTRYILGYNTDDHPMYGADANKLTFIDIPLGGDVGEKSYKAETVYTWEDGTQMIPSDDGPLFLPASSPDDKTKIVDTDTVTVYHWTPEYTGQLLVPFENPTPIVDNDNITGGAVAIAGENPRMNADGTYAYTSGGDQKVNACLGSFSGRTTFAIGVQEQVKPTRSTRAQAGISSLDDINPETMRKGGVSSTPGPENLLNQSSGGDPGDTEGNGPGDDVGASEFAPNLGTQLPSLELELGDYVTVIMDGYQVGFAIGIPVYQYEDTNYSGSEQTTEDKTDGSTTTTKKDGDGNTIKETVREENGVTTKTTTTIPPDPDLAGAKRYETITETTDKDGKTTKKKTVQLYYKKDWSDDKEKETLVYTRTEDVKPPTEQTRSEKANEGFKSANGGMATLKEFCKALTSPKKGSMKKFFDGAFDDESLDNAKNGNTTSQKVQVTFKIQISIMFEFNPIDNGYYFKTAGLAGTLGFEFTIQHRFSFCPLIYVYLKIGVEVEVKVSLSVLRKAKEGEPITTFENQGSLADLSQGKSVTFALDMRKKPVDAEAGLPEDANTARGFHLDLKGKVFMQVAEETSGGMRKTLTSGLLTGDGSTKEVLFEAYNKIVYITLTPKKTSQVTAANLKPVIGATSKTVFDGLTITPGLSLEVGAGIGVELLKFEIFIRTSVAISMTMGGYLEETEKYEGFYISSFEWTLALGFHVTVAFFNYSMDCIAIGVEGAQHGTGGYFNWDITASAVDGNVTLWEKSTYTAADGKPLGTEEPEPPDGFNIFKDNTDCAFFDANGSLTDISDKPAGNPDWSFSENVSAFRWTGGKFKGEVPQNGDLAVSKANGAKVRFSTTEDEIWIYFSGTVKIAADDNPAETFKKSPAKLKFNNSGTHSLTITANKGSKIDRYETPPTEGEDGNSAGTVTLRAAAQPQSLVHVSAPTDISGTQKVNKPGEDTRAIDPTGTADFQLSGYNTSGEARKLVDGLTVGYDYKLLQAGSENYVIYPLMVGGNPQLVMSKLVMTGSLTQNSGLVHPLDPDSATPYLLLDSDGLTNLDYSAVAGTDSIRVVWVSHADAGGQTYTVKTRTIKLTAGATNAGPTSADTSEDYRYLAAAAGNTDLWVDADGSGADNNALFKAWLLTRNPGLTETDLNSLTTATADSAAAVYTWAVNSALNDLYGSGSILRASNGKYVEIPGEAVENLEAVRLGNRTLVLYSTTQAAYFNDSDDGFVTVGADHLNEITADTERGVIRRLYLRSLDSTGFGTAKLLQTVIDFDSCTDDNLASAAMKDGVYENSALRTAQADPYYANFRFLQADLDGEGAKTVALFEMGGNTWLLKQADLETVLAGTGPVTLIPIFSEATGTDVCIGSDGDNMAVVYTAPVADSLSNAIFMAWWDKNLNDEQGGWGTPTILAMRDLQVYEDRITYDMSGEDAELAYLGKLTTQSNYTGSMNRLTFSNLQMSTRSVENKQQLIIMTQGSLAKLKEQTFVRGEGKEDYVTVVPDGDSTVAFYAIAFGAGEQALGEAKLGLSEYDFTLGSRLIGQVEFTNTGTAAVRASGDNPMTVRLMARVPGSNPEELAVWNLTRSIASGARTKLTFRAQPLTMNLPAGTTLYLEVAEDSSYFTEPFYAIIDDLLTVDDVPELSLNDFDMKFLQVREDSDGTTVADYKVELSVANNGSAKANDLFLQFSYDTGVKDEFGNAICSPVDISRSSLQTTAQMPITTRGSTDAQKGIYRMNGGGNDDLDVGYYRKVEGTLVVPASCFANEADFSGLHLRVEVYSAGDTPDIHYDVYSSDHNEYNSVNNRVEQTFKHQTTFDVPARITTALGTTLTLPISYASTGLNPDLVLTEVSDGTPNWEPRMGICYYDSARGVIVAAPNAKAQAMLEAGQKPTGLLQIKDQSTNTITTIAYTVGAMAEGVNIYKDDASFTFHDANGALTDLNAAIASNPAWIFLDKGVDLGWEGGDTGEIPMNNDLTQCNQDNAYFTFETVADSITLYFMGDVTVTSDVFNVTSTPVTPGKDSPVKYSFTKNGQGNETGIKHTVKITAKQGTKLDRYVAVYKTNTVPTTDPDAPQILWNRSFPESASVKKGTGVPMTCWILDTSGLQTVIFNGQTLSETTSPKLVKVDENLWYFDWTFTDNGPNSVRAMDGSGNISTGSFGVDWFNDVVSIGTISTAPGLARNHLSFVDANDNTVPTTGTITTPPFLKSAYTPEADERSNAYLFSNGAFSDDPLGKAMDERWLANWNGYYLVRVDKDDGTWARSITVLSNLDDTPPPVKPDLTGEGTPDAPYLIGSRADWLKMRTYVNGGNPCTGMCFLQTASFQIFAEDMVSTDTAFFKGVYDGGGYTLTFTANVTKDGIAPFWFAENATFRNMHIDGSITTSKQFAAGILYAAKGSCSFTNCRVSITIVSNRNNDGTHAGFVALPIAGSQVTFTGCVVDGSFQGSGTTNCGGFVGFTRGALVFRDCIFAPAEWQWTNSQNFYRCTGDYGRSLNNCYYLDKCADNQGTRGYAVKGGENVELTFDASMEYNVAGLRALSTGVYYDGALRAASGETVSFTPRYSGSDPDDAEDFFLASAGTLTETKGTYTLTMPAKDVTISVGVHEWGAPEYAWNEDNSQVTAYSRCAYNANHIRSETAKTNFVLTKPSTFEEEGTGYYIAEFADDYFETQIKTIVIPPVACEGGDTCPSKHFTDMPPVTNYAHLPIDWAVQNRITNGTSATKFSPDMICTRSQFVTFLWRTVGQPEPTATTSPFKDVKPGSFYYKAVLWAVEQGITNGTGANTFSPNMICSRSQVVTFLWRMANCPEPTQTECPFTDVSPKDFYYTAMLWAVGEKITTGTSATTFKPKGDCTRAQCVTFLYRQFGK